jgi:hypothetical protein
VSQSGCPGWSRSRRRLAGLAAGAAALAVSLSGCAKFDSALGQQWVQVTFGPSTTVAQLEHIRATCAHIPNVSAYPFPKQHTVINLMNSVRYNTDNATLANVAQLTQCLEKFPAVQGVTSEDSGDDGD